jgi:two-component system chemotaxis sensor kinase CheA
LAGIDFIKLEVEKLRAGDKADGDSSDLNQATHIYLEEMKQANPDAVKVERKPVSPPKQQYFISRETPTSKKNHYQAIVFFEDGCEMENIRAYTITHSLKDKAEELIYIPEDIIEDDSTADIIRQEGFQLFFSSFLPYKEIQDFLEKTIFLKKLELNEIDQLPQVQQSLAPQQILLEDQPVKIPKTIDLSPPVEEKEVQTINQQRMINVHVEKLDGLMDLVGELVISEAMVTQNPDLRGLSLDNFSKASRQLQKITGELQDMVMAIRMVPLTSTFHKMQRLVRDMSKKLNKEVHLELIGEETEVDKNIIEHISDPLMHLIRNSLDHGIEPKEARLEAGKAPVGVITLEAKNAGSDVIVMIKDDGRGLNREKILERARANGLIHKPENELTDKEINAFILAPGFSTKEKVTEFSGRGVGMDVVLKNINSVGGMVMIDSTLGQGTTMSLKIPLTLAIIDGMTIRVGKSCYTFPIAAIKESFKPKDKDIIVDTNGNEMIMVRGQCYPIMRLHQLFKVTTEVTQFSDGIIIMVENESEILCLFADELIGEQQVVVKTLPVYVKRLRKLVGLAGCTLLGDGSISLILDIGGLINLRYTS